MTDKIMFCLDCAHTFVDTSTRDTATKNTFCPSCGSENCVLKDNVQPVGSTPAIQEDIKIICPKCANLQRICYDYFVTRTGQSTRITGINCKKLKYDLPHTKCEYFEGVK